MSRAATPGGQRAKTVVPPCSTHPRPAPGWGRLGARRGMTIRAHRDRAVRGTPRPSSPRHSEAHQCGAHPGGEGPGHTARRTSPGHTPTRSDPGHSEAHQSGHAKRTSPGHTGAEQSGATGLREARAKAAPGWACHSRALHRAVEASSVPSPKPWWTTTQNRRTPLLYSSLPSAGVGAVRGRRGITIRAPRRWRSGHAEAETIRAR